jgi:hypothetical protein
MTKELGMLVLVSLLAHQLANCICANDSGDYQD